MRRLTEKIDEGKGEENCKMNGSVKRDTEDTKRINEDWREIIKVEKVGIEKSYPRKDSQLVKPC